MFQRILDNATLGVIALALTIAVLLLRAMNRCQAA